MCILSDLKIVKSIRLDLDMYREIEKISKYENRTISNAIQWLLKIALNEYRITQIEKQENPM